MYLFIKKPKLLKKYSFKRPAVKRYKHLEVAWNAQEKEKETNIDEILDKISKNGMSSLTKNERKKLEGFSTKKKND